MSMRSLAPALAVVLALATGPLAGAEPPSGRAADAAAGATAASPPGDAAQLAPDSPPATPATPATAAPVGPTAAVPSPADATSGLAIYERFVEGLSQQDCGEASPRWRAHFAHVPAQLGSGESEVMPLFGYVVDSLRAAHLPTEYALIPFVESGYRPGARSSGGPAGLWQFIALTARNHGIPVRKGYDGRLSPADATRAAVRYLKTLHGMFAGDWRLAAMAFNAGEYRVLGALKRHGQRPATADPEGLESLSGVTRAYVRKLQALSCLMLEARDDAAWRGALDRPVARLVAVELDDATGGLDGYATRHGLDPARLRRLNPALDGRTLARGQAILVPSTAAASPAAAGVAN